MEVPDFARAPLTLSGAFVEAQPAWPAAPRDRCAALGVVPTTRRVFALTDRVTVSLRVTQGSDAPLRPVALEARLIDAHAAIATSVTETIPVSAFVPDSRTAVFRLTLPLQALRIGPYRLALQASAGTAFAGRDVLFEIR